MVDQATIGESSWTTGSAGRRPSAAAGVRNGVGELMHDVVTLSELQVKLLAVDTQEAVQKARSPLVVLGAGLGFALGALPVLLLALGECLVLYLQWERALAYLVSALLGAALGGGLLYAATQQLGAVTAVFDRSRAEFADNVRWIKYALTRGKRPPR
jgi:hypothetical protein